MKIPLSFFLGLICGLIAFLFGYKIGIDTYSPPPSRPTSCPNITEAFNVAEEKKPVYSETPQMKSQNRRKISNRVYRLHKNHETPIVDLVFDEYYHPSSISKAEFIYTSLPTWKTRGENKSTVKCTEVYHTRTGSRTNQPAKCVSIVIVQDGQHSPWITAHRIGRTAGRINQYINDFTSHSNRGMDEEQLHPFLYYHEQSIDQFLEKVGPPIIDKQSSQLQHFDSRAMNSTHARRSLIIMVANEGVLNLLLNFICSCVSSGINPKSIVVFVGMQSHVLLMEELGVTAIHIPAAGAMPKEVASNYGDDTFGLMMWLKVTSVYLALHAGFDVLFQDADLVWFQDPLPHLHNTPHDVAFMDDGARSGRFNPFFANSGFYFMKNNEFTKHLMRKMVLSGVSEIHRTKSHQSVLTRHIMESTALIGLEISILSALDYPSGKMFHHNKTYMSQLRAEQVTPKVFHMCWTANTQDKITNFKSIDKWYLRDSSQCSVPSEIAKFHKSEKSLVETCCMNPRLYHGTVEIKENEGAENSLETEANEEE